MNTGMKNTKSHVLFPGINKMVDKQVFCSVEEEIEKKFLAVLV